ncbi:MAG TPA: MotA/TolQ/ExbB proton channel family protein [Chromatiaceae bacterium]|nr:MotA/TolQ/ExbB proton channel family protein [Chromatiaceae bacterium]
MTSLSLLQPLRSLVDSGGIVVAIIMAVALVLWILLLERAWLLWALQRHFTRQSLVDWHSRIDPQSRRSGWIRQQLISENRQRLESTLPVIAGLIGTLPMLGLFGTVSGMVLIFDQVAINGSPEFMAEGIARATLPTLAGMITAISGLAGYGIIKSRIRPAIANLRKELKQ